MTELLDILDSNGNLTGKVASRLKAHEKGLFHNTVHIWFYSNDGKILLQKRGRHKKTFPMFWDVSVAGHVDAGESLEIAALREVSEEIGLNIMNKDLQKIGVFKSVHQHQGNIIDCEFNHVFLVNLIVPFSDLQPEKDEVFEIRLADFNFFKRAVFETNASQTQFVPHTKQYYNAVINALAAKLD